MNPTFTEDDIDKPVESAAGEELGTVTAFDPDTAYVEPAPGVSESLTAVLDWDGGGDGPVPVGSDAVRRITDDAVVLEAELPDGGSVPAAMDAVEADASRELEVDPTELTDRDPEAEIARDEDVGDRADGRPGRGGADGPTTEDGAPDEGVSDPESDRGSDEGADDG